MIDYDESHLVSPSDGKVSAYDLKEGTSFGLSIHSIRWNLSQGAGNWRKSTAEGMRWSYA